MPRIKSQIETSNKGKTVPTVQKQPEVPGKRHGPVSTTATQFSTSGAPVISPTDDLSNDSDQNPRTASRARLMRSMQRTVGNTRMSRIFGTIQNKLEVGSANDPFETSFDAVSVSTEKAVLGSGNM